jgi:hypothetical protein
MLYSPTNLAIHTGFGWLDSLKGEYTKALGKRSAAQGWIGEQMKSCKDETCTASSLHEPLSRPYRAYFLASIQTQGCASFALGFGIFPFQGIKPSTPYESPNMRTDITAIG